MGEKRKYKIAASFIYHKQKLATKETGGVTHMHSVYEKAQGGKLGRWGWREQ